MAKKGTYTYEYPHPAVTADSVVFGYDGKQLKVLLIKRGQEKEASTRAFVGFWALPGGFLDVERDKTIAHTAARELREETKLKVNPKDHHSRRGLFMIVGQRRGMLEYVKKNDINEYRALIQKLGIRK